MRQYTEHYTNNSQLETNEGIKWPRMRKQALSVCKVLLGSAFCQKNFSDYQHFTASASMSYFYVKTSLNNEIIADLIIEK